MDPTPLVHAIIALAQAQVRLGLLLTKALLGLERPPADSHGAQFKWPTDEAVDRAAGAIQREMLRNKEVGLASFLRTNFPPAEIRRIAQAALEAAGNNQQESSMGSTKGSGQTDAGKPHKSEDEMQREHLGPRGVPGKPDDAEMTPQQEKNIPKNVDPGHTA